MFHFPRCYLAATVILAAFSSAVFGQAIDLVCSGTMNAKEIRGTAGPGATRVDLERRHISTPVGNFEIIKIEETKIFFSDPQEKQLIVSGHLDRLSGQMTVTWFRPEEQAKMRAGLPAKIERLAELRCSAAKRLF